MMRVTLLGFAALQVVDIFSIDYLKQWSSNVIEPYALQRKLY